MKHGSILHGYMVKVNDTLQYGTLSGEPDESNEMFRTICIDQEIDLPEKYRVVPVIVQQELEL